MKNNYRVFFIIPIIFIYLLSPLKIQAQSWQWITGQSCGRSGTGDGLADAYLCNVDKYSNVYTCGIFEGGNHGDSICFGSYKFYRQPLSSNIVLTKYDTLGNVKWVVVSDSGNAQANNIVTDKAGNIYLYGYMTTDSLKFGSEVIINPYYTTPGLYPWCYFLVKFDATGNVIWHKTGGKITAQAYTLTQSIGIDAKANIYICGTFMDTSIQIGPFTVYNTNNGTLDVFAAKYDSSGKALWAKGFGGPKDDLGLGISCTSNGYCYLVGSFHSASISLGSTILKHTYGKPPISDTGDFFITKLDTNGSVIWAKCSEGSARPYATLVDKKNNVYVIGQVLDSTLFNLDTHSFTTPYLYCSGFITNYDPNGNINWAKTVYPKNKPAGAKDRIVLWGIANDPCNNIWVSGVMLSNDSVIVDSHDTIPAMKGVAYTSMLISYNDLGTALQSQAFTFNEDDNSGLASDKSGKIYFSNDVGGNLTIGSLTYKWTKGGEAIFLSKYDPNLGCYELPNEPLDKANTDVASSEFNIFPNPANDRITITGFVAINSISITSTLGKTLHSGNYNSERISVNISQLPPGIYFIRINGIKIKKFIKE